MSRVGKGVGKSIVLGLLVAGAVATIGGAAEAAPGTVRDSVNIPASWRPWRRPVRSQPRHPRHRAGRRVGGKARLPEDPGLARNELRVRPRSQPLLPRSGERRHARTTRRSSRPSRRSSRRLRLPTPCRIPAGKPSCFAPTRETFWPAAGTPPALSVLWSVDFSPFNNTNPPSNPPVPDGTAKFLNFGPTGSSCSGIAWDATDKTVYQTGSTGNVFRLTLTETGSQLPPPASPIPSGCTTPISGLGIAGTSLFISCAAQATPTVVTPTIRQVYKVNGARHDR